MLPIACTPCAVRRRISAYLSGLQRARNGFVAVSRTGKLKPATKVLTKQPGNDDKTAEAQNIRIHVTRIQ